MKEDGKGGFAPQSLDHVALWVSTRHSLGAFLTECLGLRVIERNEDFTLLGAGALHGKITLFDAPGPRQPGALERIVFRVRDLERAADRVAEACDGRADVEREDGLVHFDAGEGLRIGLVEADAVDYDLDHVVLRVSDPDSVAPVLGQMGFERRNGSLAVDDRSLVLAAGGGEPVERPLLNHIALLVASADEARAGAERLGLEIDKVVDAANTRATFVRGPEAIVIEYVEHKPEFALV